MDVTAIVKNKMNESMMTAHPCSMAKPHAHNYELARTIRHDTGLGARAPKAEAGFFLRTNLRTTQFFASRTQFKKMAAYN